MQRFLVPNLNILIFYIHIFNRKPIKIQLLFKKGIIKFLKIYFGRPNSSCYFLSKRDSPRYFPGRRIKLAVFKPENLIKLFHLLQHTYQIFFFFVLFSSSKNKILRLEFISRLFLLLVITQDVKRLRQRSGMIYPALLKNLSRRVQSACIELKKARSEYFIRENTVSSDICG